MKVAIVLGLACCAVVLPACASIDVVPASALHVRELTPGRTPIAHVRASNWGWYFLKFIPIWTGNVDRPKYPQLCDWFTDNVSVEDVVGMIDAKCQELGGTTLTDLQTIDKSSYHISTIFFWLNEIEVSANISK